MNKKATFDVNMVKILNSNPMAYDSLYQTYQLGKTVGFSSFALSKEESEEIEILSLLDKLGLPMNQAGTYLLKEMIMNSVNELRTTSTQEEKNMIKCAMQEPFSQFYVDTARNNLDLGIKTFHKLVMLSYFQTDLRKFNQSGMKRNGIDLYRSDYKSEAYKIAEYYVKEKSQMNETGIIKEKPVVLAKM